VPDDVSSGAADRAGQVEALFDEQYPGLCRLAWLMVGDRDRAEEVVMEAFLRTFVAWGRIRDVERAGAYLRRAVVNQSRTRARRQSTEGRANARLSGRARPPVDDPIQARDDAAVVLDAVRALPHRQRAAVVLRYYEDLSEAAIAETLRCSVGTVKSQLAKARATLTRALGATDHEEAPDA
jgi:RNA polymerase sigma-70 factor (sigma-E family)